MLIYTPTYLFLVVEALVVIFENGLAFHFTLVVFGRGVDHVAGEHFLPEGEAAGGAWACCQLRVMLSLVFFLFPI